MTSNNATRFGATAPPRAALDAAMQAASAEPGALGAAPQERGMGDLTDDLLRLVLDGLDTRSFGRVQLVCKELRGVALSLPCTEQPRALQAMINRVRDVQGVVAALKTQGARAYLSRTPSLYVAGKGVLPSSASTYARLQRAATPGGAALRWIGPAYFRPHADLDIDRVNLNMGHMRNIAVQGNPTPLAGSLHLRSLTTFLDSDRMPWALLTHVAPDARQAWRTQMRRSLEDVLHVHKGRLHYPMYELVAVICMLIDRHEEFVSSDTPAVKNTMRMRLLVGIAEGLRLDAASVDTSMRSAHIAKCMMQALEGKCIVRSTHTLEPAVFRPQPI